MRQECHAQEDNPSHITGQGVKYPIIPVSVMFRVQEQENHDMAVQFSLSSRKCEYDIFSGKKDGGRLQLSFGLVAQHTARTPPLPPTELTTTDNPGPKDVARATTTRLKIKDVADKATSHPTKDGP